MQRAFLEFHHVEPFANGGPPTVENITLRGWRHNRYDSEVMFGPTGSRPPNMGLDIEARRFNNTGGIDQWIRTPPPGRGDFST